MLRSFVQVVRSGRTGRKSLGLAPKAMVLAWLSGASDRALLHAAVGNDPSLADVIRMVHPKPESPEREALFAWIVGRPCEVARLLRAVQDWLSFKATGVGAVPDVPFQMRTQLELSTGHWAQIACRGLWQMVRQNLNTFHRHGVFGRAEAVAQVAALLQRGNRDCRVLPFDTEVRDVRLEPRDTILTNAERLAALAGRGTNCSAPLTWLDRHRRSPDLVVFVSDNQSWVDARAGGQGTAMRRGWEQLKRRNPKAKLVCIDIAPYGTPQAQGRGRAQRRQLLGRGLRPDRHLRRGPQRPGTLGRGNRPDRDLTRGRGRPPPQPMTGNTPGECRRNYRTVIPRGAGSKPAVAARPMATSLSQGEQDVSPPLSPGSFGTAPLSHRTDHCRRNACGTIGLACSGQARSSGGRCSAPLVLRSR